MPVIYGIDTSKPYTAVDVRNAVIECFYLAHQKILKNQFSFVAGEKVEEMKKQEIRNLVRDFFDKSNGSYNQPDKKSIIKVCSMLAKYSAFYRAPEVIKKHYGEIMTLLEGLSDEKK